MTGQYRGSLTCRRGMTGKLLATTNYDVYKGPYEITPLAHESQKFSTTDKLLTEDITVVEIPYYEVTNDQNGTTCYIAKEV